MSSSFSQSFGDVAVLVNDRFGVSQHGTSVPLMTRQAFAQAVGLPIGVLTAQAVRGYWPQITIGKRVFINIELLRSQCAAKAFS